MKQKKRGRWSTPELVRLRQLFPRTSVARIARALNRSDACVRTKAHQLFARRGEQGPWTDAADASLRRGYGIVALADLAVVLGRPVGELRRRAGELRAAQRSGPWRHDELTLLKRLYPSRSDADLEVCLSRTAADIAARAAELCLRKDKARSERPLVVTPMPRWTADEVRRLAQAYPYVQTIDIARELGRSVASVANKAHQLGLGKSDAVKSRVGALNAALRTAR